MCGGRSGNDGWFSLSTSVFQLATIIPVEAAAGSAESAPPNAITANISLEVFPWYLQANKWVAFI